MLSKILFQEVKIGGFFVVVEPKFIYWPFFICKLLDSLKNHVALAGRLNFTHCCIGFPMEILQTHKWKGMHTSSSSPPLLCAFHVEKLCLGGSSGRLWHCRLGIKTATDLYQFEVLHQFKSLLLIPGF